MKLLLIMLVIAMLALCGCSKEKETNQDNNIGDVSVKHELTNVEFASSIKYTDNTSTITLVDLDGIWYFEDDMKAGVDQAEANKIINVASHLTANDVVKDAGALTDYGLETPVYTVILSDSAGQEITIYIGNSLDDGTYYATIGEKEKVYIISEQLVRTLEFDRELLIEYAEDDLEDDYLEHEYIEDEYIEDEYIEDEYIEDEYIEDEYIEDDYIEEDISETEE